MNLNRTAATSFGVLAITGILWAASSQDKKPEAPKQDKPVAVKAEMAFASADTAKYKDVAPGAQMATIWGDPDKGAHRAFTKFAPGATFPLHTHTSEMHIVVIKGAYVYKPEKGDEKRVTAGCYIDIPGGDRHSSSGDAKEGALFYEESAGKFDLIPVEAPKK
jgi:quercetin dioxygenase-like cupin family protein